MINIKGNNNIAFWTESGFSVDADGAVTAYSANGGLDFLQNAGGPSNWFGIVTDNNGEPIVQGPDDPAPGYYISTTALVDKTKKETDPHRYVDSQSVPYLSLPSNAKNDYGLHLGDVCLIFCRTTGQSSAAVCADIGPAHKLNEGSIALANALLIPNSPKNGGCESGIVYVIFKNSSRGWPRTNEDVAQQVQDIINATGGFEQYLS